VAASVSWLKLLRRLRLDFMDAIEYPSCMLIVHVHVHAKPDSVESFKMATLANARSSLKEPGVIRFDVLQQQDDPAHFVLVEVYRDAAAASAHKETPHYPVWRDAVAPMMAEPRRSVKFNNVFPQDESS
jgi:(4S)-4-hydroxy-5-phosphonooxypentane-2,3-dione isomerase